MEIRIDRHELTLGTARLEYRDLAVNIPGPIEGPGEIFLYVEDPAYKGSSPVLQYALNGGDAVNGPGRVLLGSIKLSGDMRIS